MSVNQIANTCKTCRDSHRLGRGQIADCSSFGTAIHRGDFCGKDAERGCRPLRCALGECEDCQHYDDALHMCPEEYTSKRLVRYKTSEPVSSAGKVFEDWVYRECAIRPFLKLLRDFYLQKYRLFCFTHVIDTHTHLLPLHVYRLHNWIYKWQDAERRRVIECMRPHQLVICMDYANKYSHWQQDGATCKHDRQSSHLVIFVLSNPVYATSAKINKVSHTCEAWTYWNEDPKQTPECIHAALRHLITIEKKRAVSRAVSITEVIIFSDRCGEQNAGRKNFRMCSESAMFLKLVLLWIFACPHHFAGVWDAWGGSETKLLKNVEKDGTDTMRTVVDCVVKLRELRSKLIGGHNDGLTVVREARECNEDGGDNVHETDGETDGAADDVDTDDSSDTECSCVDVSSDDEEVTAPAVVKKKKTFRVSACHVHLLQLCTCGSHSGAVCNCVPNPRVTDTIFYKRDPRYEAAVIKGCASMYAYRFLPRQNYMVHIRQYACETCPGCVATRKPEDRYATCVNLNTVRATSYKGKGYKTALRSDFTRQTGWVKHKIVPVKTSTVAGTRATDGLTRVDHRARLQYVGGLRPGDHVFMANISDNNGGGEFRPRDFWLAQLLPPPNSSTIVWKTRHALPPDCPAGSYCCKVQWFKRRTRDGRVFGLASAQYISLSCIVPTTFKITLDQISEQVYELSEEMQSRILDTMNGLVIDD